MLAWALTVCVSQQTFSSNIPKSNYHQVHKAQGQTIARVKIDLAGTFAPGQGKCWNLYMIGRIDI